MTLYYTLCFMLLSAELTLFSAIICPMPFALRKTMMHFLSENPIVAKIQYGLKITFIFVAVLFVDAVQRMLKVAKEGTTAKQEKGVQDVRVETNHAARKFYAQRNLYLTGATLILALILARVFAIVLDLIIVQEQINSLKNTTAKSSAANGTQNTELKAEVRKLKESLAVKERDLSTLQKQAGQNIAAFNEAADAQPVSSKKID